MDKELISHLEGSLIILHLETYMDLVYFTELQKSAVTNIQYSGIPLVCQRQKNTVMPQNRQKSCQNMNMHFKNF